MSDNTQINAPTIEGGQDIASEDVGGGVNMPRGKIVIGDHGTDGGDVTVTNPFPVQISNGSTTILPAQDSTLTSGNAKVQVQDGSGHTLGISSSPLRIDPVGTTTQPISALSLPLPTGAAQDSTITARLNTLGQKASVGSAPVVIASDQSPVSVAQSTAAALSGAWPIQLTDGTHTMPTGDAFARPVFTDVSPIDLNSTWTDWVGANSGVAKTSSGTFYEIDATNTTNTTLYLMMFQSATVPSNSTTPNFFFPIPMWPNEKVSFRVPRPFSNGFAWAASTTQIGLTLASGTPLGVSVEWR